MQIWLQYFNCQLYEERWSKFHQEILYLLQIRLFIYILDCIFVILFRILLNSEEPPSGNFYFPLSTFRRGYSGVKITRSGLQANRSNWYSLFSTAVRFMLRQPREAYNPDCVLPTVRHGGGSLIVWAAISL